MKNLKLQIVLLINFCFFLGNSLLQAQDLFKYTYWNGKNLEIVYAKINTDNGDLEELYYQATSQINKVKLKLKKKAERYKWTATYPDTEQNFEVFSGMTIVFTYPNADSKEFLYAMEYVNGDEKILMGSMPILGDIIYQKGDNDPELWLENADLNCDDGQRESNPAYLCNFITAKGEELQLMIDQQGNNITLWRNGEIIVFKEQK